MTSRIFNSLTLLAIPIAAVLTGCAHLPGARAVTPAGKPGVFSDFDAGDIDGWTMFQGEILWQPATSGVEASPQGHARGVFTGSKTSYYIAPPKFHGDWTRFGALRLDLCSSGARYFNSGSGMYGDLFLANGELTAQRLFDRRPAEEWDSFEIPLKDDGNWTLGGGAKELTEVLCNVTNFQIRAEYGVGDDKSSLDNVHLIPGK